MICSVSLGVRKLVNLAPIGVTPLGNDRGFAPFWKSSCGTHFHVHPCLKVSEPSGNFTLLPPPTFLGNSIGLGLGDGEGGEGEGDGEAGDGEGEGEGEMGEGAGDGEGDGLGDGLGDGEGDGDGFGAGDDDGDGDITSEGEVLGDGDGFGDAPYVVFENITDHTPLMVPFPINSQIPPLTEQENPMPTPTTPPTAAPTQTALPSSTAVTGVEMPPESS